jgi:transcriptional regulator with XRE-family HTH domain
MPFTQEEMAHKLNLSPAAYKKIEAGTTKLDVDRLSQIAEILEISMNDLINSNDDIYINQILNNQGGISNKEVHVNDSSEKKDLYDKLLLEKDKTIERQQAEIEFLKKLITK